MKFLYTVFIVSALTVLLSSCQTSGDNPLIDLKEPSFQSDRGNSGMRFRLRVNAGVTPIHSIRFEENTDSNATVTLTRLNKGYRIQGTRRVEFRKTFNVETDKARAFLDLVEKVDYWNLTSPPDVLWTGEDAGVCLHPTSFHFDATQDDKYGEYFFSICLPILEGLQLMKALYDLAGIDESDDWSLHEYFSETWEKPEFQDLLVVE